MVDHDFDVVDPIDVDHHSQISQRLVIDGDYAVSFSGDATSHPSTQSSQFEIDNRPPSQTLSQLYQFLVDHEEIVLATSAPISQAFASTQPSLNDSSTNVRSQLFDEAANNLNVNNLELQVTEDIGDLLSNFPEGWWEGETKMVYHTNETRWGSEGVLNEEI